jgi:streptogramin lyase
MNLASGIAQVDPSGQVVNTWEVGRVDYDVAVGDGGVWFLGAKGLERLNPTSGEVQSWQSTPDGETPIFIVVGSEGVWVGTYEGHLYFRPFE